MPPKHAFDLSDLSDLPAELAAKALPRQGRESNHGSQILNIVVQAAEHDLDAVSINQIVVFAHRLNVKVPMASTIRNHLNAAVKRGDLAKRSRSTYGVAKPTFDSAPV